LTQLSCNGSHPQSSFNKPPWIKHGKLKVSDNGRFLQFSDGTPFFWLGDTAWALHQNISREEVIKYLDNTADLGFNVIQLMTVNIWALSDSKNYFGDKPYLGENPSELNLEYWQHLEWVIDQAAERGMFVFLVYGSPGRTDNHGAIAHTPEEAYDYGYAVGEFFRDKQNIIWCGGIDVNPDNTKIVSTMGMEGWHAMAEGVVDGINGIRNYDGQADWTSTLMSYHPAGNKSSSEWFHDAPWLDFNGSQVSLTVLDALEYDYNKDPVKPAINLEPWYEGCTWCKGWEKDSIVYDYEVRVQAYQSIFAGACGFTYGHHDIYPFDSTGLDIFNKKWRKVLLAPCRMQMQHLRKLMESKPVDDRVLLPKFVVNSVDVDDLKRKVYERIAATGAADGSWVFVYSPLGKPVEIDMTMLSGKTYSAEWFNPRTGESTTIREIEPAGIKTFVPPGTPGNGNDWVLSLSRI
jgi:hypothetical protein